jgi:hypothetical protein
MLINIQKYVDSKELYYVGELCAKIIHSMQVDGEVHLYTKEAKNSQINGLFSLLDQLCVYWEWDKTKITIETSSPITKYSNYNIVYTEFCHPCAVFDTTSQIHSWNKEKYYGLFIGRATSDRIRAIHNHKNFKYNSHGLTSFNEDLFNYMSYPNLVEYFFHSNQTYAEMLTVKPYSDIRELVETPNSAIIPPPYNSKNWGKVYEKIAIEIVCETSTEEDCFGPSEKILRPCYYKRPFLVIGSPNFLKNYQKLGYKTFDGIINESYDQYSGFARVDAVFNILEKLINRNRINTLLDECADILEHNHQWILKEKQRHTELMHDHRSKINHN